MKGREVRIVEIRGDILNIVGIGEDIWWKEMLLSKKIEKEFKDIRRGGDELRWVGWIWRFGKVLIRDWKRRMDRSEKEWRMWGKIKKIGDGKKEKERIGVKRMMMWDLGNSVVIDDEKERKVELERIEIEKGGKGMKDGKIKWFKKKRIKEKKWVIRMKIVSLERGKKRYLIVKKIDEKLFLKILIKIEVDVEKIGKVRKRIIELIVGKREEEKVGKKRGIVEVIESKIMKEMVIGNRIEKEEENWRKMSVEKWRGDKIEKMKENIDIMKGGMEEIEDLIIGNKEEEGRKVKKRRKRIKKRSMVRWGNMDKEKLRKEGSLKDEISVKSEEIGFGKGG